ncbi:hypothetical protein DID78_04005 [Candidatus Marinamargulisbacteria bacterium SCGC AG-343-D04]|nr:hypothetical protein DID78_04005 [Candidatus Marinamargulisbacteria bacterium SCGC AG-343-D04]
MLVSASPTSSPSPHSQAFSRQSLTRDVESRPDNSLREEGASAKSTPPKNRRRSKSASHYFTPTPSPIPPLKKRRSSDSSSPTPPLLPLYNVLLVGEADFSFSTAYASIYPHCNMLSTRYEKTPPADSCYQKLQGNIEALKEHKASVLDGVDAQKLTDIGGIQSFIEKHPDYQGKKGFDKIYFNFPFITADEKIMRLNFKDILVTLKEFGRQAKSLLKERGQVYLGLVNHHYQLQQYYQFPEFLDHMESIGFTLLTPGKWIPEEQITPLSRPFHFNKDSERPPSPPPEKFLRWDSHGLFRENGYRHRQSDCDSPAKSVSYSSKIIAVFEKK